MHIMAEREIDLIDLLVDILSHWRGLLVSMLVGALLLGVFSYVRAYQRTGAAQNKGGLPGETISPEEQLHALDELLADTEKMAVNTVLDDEQEIAKHQQYVEDSILMQMDPYHIPKRELFYKIQMDDMGQSYMLRTVYADLVNGVGMLQWVEEQAGISSASAAELISGEGKTGITVLNGVQETESGGDCLKVTIRHYDEKECERLAQCVKDYIEQQHKLLSPELGEHEVVLLSESASIIMDTGVRDLQINYSNTKINFMINIARSKEAFTEEQRAYYALLTDGVYVPEIEDDSKAELESETGPEPVAAKPSVSVKYVAVGAVLFAFIYAGILFVIYVFNSKLRTIDELQKLYNISQLGLIVKDKGKKKFFIDRWIAALRNWNKRQFTREQSLELAAAAIKISAGKQELDTIYLMGCDLKAGADVVCQELKEKLAKENIEVRILDNVLYDAETMEELESAKGIVLVEKAMSTMYNEILNELELASRQGIKVLGGIVVE